MWGSHNRHYPFSFLYEYQTTKYSDIVQNATDFSIKALPRKTPGHIQISLGHPEIPTKAFVLRFDEKRRLVERRLINHFPDEPRPRLSQKHVFSNYEKYEHSSGEPIWFPQKAVYHFYAGVLADGTPVEYWAKVIEVNELEFNVEIPDEVFVLSHFRNVEALHLSGHGLNDENLLEIKNLDNLRKLNLQRNEITDEGLRHLKAITHLRSLDLSSTGITDEGLAIIGGLKNLKSLNLARTEVTDKGLQHLPTLKRLEKLMLYGTDVTDKGLEPLKKLKNLQRLYLMDTEVTERGVRELKKQLPRCRILN